MYICICMYIYMYMYIYVCMYVRLLVQILNSKDGRYAYKNNGCCAPVYCTRQLTLRFCGGFNTCYWF